ncbi:hypothetical protein, variant 2 [Aphanomyces astaci]|uniref:Elongator complex protein 6 n=1 Tax=Aphanomyces astaci TaxID=112090 RepID=W4G0U3_APHAT|nr:hypothetical protein, variant 2 [Aphanomyces astaci]ETV73320.1 hypothetical protein, variant 2 [Aphanomyces astaci]|eukprot:XP_009837197.1 hypothetical protein, variant 2 [Aphanomyces astaci]
MAAAAWPSELVFTPLNLPRKEFILINDVVEASGSFFMHHITSMFLKADQRVCVVALADSLDHFAAVGRKLGANVVKAQHASPPSWLHIDGFSHPADWCKPQHLQEDAPSTPSSVHATFSPASDDAASLCALFCQVRDFVGTQSSPVCIAVDDTSALVDMFGVRNTLTFLRYCRHLALSTASVLVVVNHTDVEADGMYFTAALTDLATFEYSVRGLDSGYCKDIHGAVRMLM